MIAPRTAIFSADEQVEDTGERITYTGKDLFTQSHPAWYGYV
jgi:hypothetical protein